MTPLNQTLNLNFTSPADICLENGHYSQTCLNKWFCPQISSYFTNTALTLIILYVVFTWLMWAYWRWVHDKIDWAEITQRWPFVAVWLDDPDPLSLRSKVRIELFLRDKIEKLMIGFLVIFYYFYR